ncbi:TRAP transporter substrate-binding protein [Marinobacterium arenosum]|uniref:TRAP transporter substrate-binding protein n=1 Tax=Marinobacterium arenosum TaxID=2862496 RepID=UPI001C93A5C1|nr:TRAP transporter substrate-binding protein [Marinobacterium arenosum]MBY4678930.1 TRAP transporter substrate-binding protein [Marinobacterium arenosum]
MNHKNKIAKVLSLTAGLLFSASAATLTHAANFKIAVGDGAGGTQHELGKTFVTELEKASGGKHSAKLFLNGQLGSEQDTVNDAAIGTLDFSILAINNVTPFSPSVGVLTLPYMIQSLDDAVKLTQGPVGQELVENTLRDAGVRIIGWAYSGFRVLTNSKQPVRTLDDLQGMVVRVPKNEIMIDTYKAWGINPTPMAWSETFTALQQQVVDGQDNPYITVYAMKFDEVQKYVTNIRYLFSIEPLIVSEAVFQEQDEATQQAILAAGKAATEHSAKWLVEQEDAIKKELATRGMEISEPANGEKEWIEKATNAVWPKFYDSIGGKKKLNEVLRQLGRDEV